MDWSDMVKKAAVIALNGTITFGQLDALLSTGNYNSEELADLFLAFRAEGINIVEDKPNVG